MKFAFKKDLRKLRYKLAMDDRMRPALLNIRVNERTEEIVPGSELIQLALTMENVISVRIGDLFIPIKPKQLTLHLQLPFTYIHKWKEIIVEGAFENLHLAIETITSVSDLSDVVDKLKENKMPTKKKRYIVYTEELTELKQLILSKKLTYHYE